MDVPSAFPCVGLFGTCGASRWRAPFIEAYLRLGIPFFNPVKDNWCPEDAAEEARHLATDGILLFPVTGETYGTGSLAETGFSLQQAIRSVGSSHRFVLVLIEPTLNPSLRDANPVAHQESLRARALVQAHLDQVQHPNVFVVQSLETMLATSLELHGILAAFAALRARL
jgi:hypothetical protein